MFRENSLIHTYMMLSSEMEVKSQEGDLEVVLAKLFFLDKLAQWAEGAKKIRKTLGIIRNGAKNKTKGFMSFYIFNRDCNSGQSQFRSMQQSRRKYRRGNYNVQRVGAAALRGEGEKAGEKSQERDDKDLQNHASNPQNCISSTLCNNTTRRHLVKLKDNSF